MGKQKVAGRFYEVKGTENLLGKVIFRDILEVDGVCKLFKERKRVIGNTGGVSASWKKSAVNLILL